MDFLKCNPKWTRQPKQVQMGENEVVITTERGTDLWARTYYGFQNDNAPVFQIETDDKYFSKQSSRAPAVSTSVAWSCI